MPISNGCQTLYERRNNNKNEQPQNDKRLVARINIDVCAFACRVYTFSLWCVIMINTRMNTAIFLHGTCFSNLDYAYTLCIVNSIFHKYWWAVRASFGFSATKMKGRWERESQHEFDVNVVSRIVVWIELRNNSWTAVCKIIEQFDFVFLRGKKAQRHFHLPNEKLSSVLHTTMFATTFSCHTSEKKLSHACGIWIVLMLALSCALVRNSCLRPLPYYVTITLPNILHSFFIKFRNFSCSILWKNVICRTIWVGLSSIGFIHNLQIHVNKEKRAFISQTVHPQIFSLLQR